MPDMDMEDESAANRPAEALRIGIMVDEFVQPAWVARTLKEIAADSRFVLSVVILNVSVNDASPTIAKHSRMSRWWKNRNSLPYALYSRIDRRRYARPGDPEELIDISGLLEPIPRVEVSPRMTKHCDYFEPEAINRIRECELDVILRFGFRILKGEVLHSARHGVWSFHHADNSINRGGPPGFWEVMEKQPLTGATLQILTEELDAGVVLGKSYSRTDPVSATANRHNFYWQARVLLTTKLGELHSDPRRFTERAGEQQYWHAYSRRLFLAPSPRETTVLVARTLWRLIGRKLRELFYREQWFLAYRTSGVRNNVPDSSMYKMKELIPPPDRFWADPIPVEQDGKIFVFFEELPYAVGRGHISVLEFDRKGPSGPPRKVLERPYHLSYPFVFQWNGHWYMVPESASQRSVELYRASNFPDEWKLEKTLLSDIRAVDATFAQIEGRWWMFVAEVAHGASEATLLNLYFSDSPVGDWMPHPQNPIKIDVRSARPAGPLFQHKGHWYRPAQSGVPDYGSGMVINRIIDLTTSSYAEEVVSEIRPDWRHHLTGTHTIAAVNGLTVIDARHRVSRFR